MGRITFSDGGGLLEYGERADGRWAPARTHLVFDEWILTTDNHFTSSELNYLLASGERYHLQAVTDNVTGTLPTLTVEYQHSADERNFVAKNTAPEINAAPLVVGATTSVVGLDSSGTRAHHHAARLAIKLGGTAPTAHVKVFVTFRPLA
jgi:hypothetical protein